MALQITFKETFQKKYETLTNWKEYEKAIQEFPKKSIRINTLKTNIAKVKKSLNTEGWNVSRIPWCKEGFYIEHESKRRDIGNTQEHLNGEIFIQRSVSMIPSIILNPKPNDVVLDMAAAPGAKTTHMASLMKNQGIIIANDADAYRINGLIANLQRCSVMNAVTTKMSGEKLTGSYNKILLDAPCSGSGLIIGKKQKTIDTLKVWNPNTIKRLRKLQKKLILHAYSLLKPKGALVYSTCSLEPEEDEDIVAYLLEKTNAREQKINVNIKSSNKTAIKIWPQYYGTEGFFVAKIIKP